MDQSPSEWVRSYVKVANYLFKNYKMKIIITESQYRSLTEENLKDFLFKFWDNQKEDGEQPSLDDIIYQLVGHSKNTSFDRKVIRPIWYEYNGGYENLLQQIKDESEGKKLADKFKK